MVEALPTTKENYLEKQCNCHRKKEHTNLCKIYAIILFGWSQKPNSPSLQKQCVTHFYPFVCQVTSDVFDCFNTKIDKKIKEKTLKRKLIETIKTLYPMLNNYSLGFSPLHCLREMKFPISSPSIHRTWTLLVMGISRWENPCVPE